MAYATATEVQNEFKGTTWANDKPMTAAKVDAWIAEFSAKIDSRIYKRYSVPITDTNALLVIKLIVKNLVAARIKRILNAEKSEPSKREEDESDKLEKQAEDMITEIVDGKMELFSQAKSGILTASSFNVSEGKTPIVQKDIDQW